LDNLRNAISASYLADEDVLSDVLIGKGALSPAERLAVDYFARDLVQRIRGGSQNRNLVDSFTQEYDLSSKEGLALLCMAETMPRIYDKAAADHLIRDQLRDGDWRSHLGHSDSFAVNRLSNLLTLAAEIESPRDETGDVDSRAKHALASRYGTGAIRTAIDRGVSRLGQQFVFAQTIAEALKKADPLMDEGYRLSFDMLSEAALTRATAAQNYSRYREAIQAIAAAANDPEMSLFEQPSVSIKLSALHPRFEYRKRDQVLAELVEPLSALCADARNANIAITFDAEESDRLELVLDLFEALGTVPALRRWDGLGLSVQAYQKRALAVIEWLGWLAEQQRRRIPVRLVKGAFWDTEIRRARALGLPDYPVFTRKVGTDTSYLACARALLARSKAFFPQFATHNAHTLTAVSVLAGTDSDYEFHRFYGMADALYGLYPEVLRPQRIGAATRLYAPVGGREYLLAFLVRRLLENGANTSFANRLANDKIPISELVADPVQAWAKTQPRRNPDVQKPQSIVAEAPAATGLLLGDPAQATPLLTAVRSVLVQQFTAHPTIDGQIRERPSRPARDPANRERVIGEVSEATTADIHEAFDSSVRALGKWHAVGETERAAILARAADLFENKVPLLMALLVREAGMTLQAALRETLATIEFLRSIPLHRGVKGFNPITQRIGAETVKGTTRPAPGIFVCVSPANAPLTAFVQLVGRTLQDGHAVLSRPAYRTPLVASAAVHLLLEAGVPGGILHFLPGDGEQTDTELFHDQRLTGVALAGTREMARKIERLLASRREGLSTIIGHVPPLHAIIADGSALPEHVARDAIASAFDGSGQASTSLKLLCLADSIAEPTLELIAGAIEELKLGDPLDLATDLGPLIDEDARAKVDSDLQQLIGNGQLLLSIAVPATLEKGVFYGPHLFEVTAPSAVAKDISGPLLHVLRFSPDRLTGLCEALAASHPDLRLGVHSRIRATLEIAHRQIANVELVRDRSGVPVSN
jgi:RHH-type proline utilization regulon transcriptional repressor/proline dehydrogenase/delta 1-pyrroline-5-carboxylate dehydrogenase